MSGCPVGYGNTDKRAIESNCSGDSCPIVRPSSATSANGAASANNIDPSVASGGDMTLPSNRVQSSIKKPDGSVWLYPSPRQFYKALTIKNKTSAYEKEYMPDVVSVHNEVNERTWNQVLKYEKALGCSDPTLVRFAGKFDSPSYKAVAWNRIGDLMKQVGLKSEAAKTFDTHHWYVDRCGQGVNRYVIDYYDVPAGNEVGKAKQNETSAKSAIVSDSVSIDVRPAIDSVSGFASRLKAELGLILGWGA